MEIYILESLKYNLMVPIALRFYERYAKCAFYKSSESNINQSLEYNLGLYLLFLVAMFPGIQFTYNQSLIAASVTHLVMRIQNYEPNWSTYLTELTGFSRAELETCT